MEIKLKFSAIWVMLFLTIWTYLDLWSTVGQLGSFFVGAFLLLYWSTSTAIDIKSGEENDNPIS
jgi:hypothetical protein